MNYSTHHLDYLSRSFLDDYQDNMPGALSEASLFIPPKESVKLLRITGLSRTWDNQPSNSSEDSKRHYRTEYLLPGLFGMQVPLIYVITCNGVNVTLAMGTCASRFSNTSPENSTKNLLQLLKAHYPGITCKEIDSDMFAGQTNHYGILTGIPTIKKQDDLDNPTQLDSLIHSLSGQEWGISIVAQPLTTQDAQRYRHMATHEMRKIENVEQPKIRRDPFAEEYYKTLELLTQQFQVGLSAGLWAVTSYYFSPHKSTFDCLGANFCSCLSGEKSLPDPIRAIPFNHAAQSAAGYGQLILKPEDGPGNFTYPYRFQTLLNSYNLSALIHLPRLELPGFTIRDGARFDVSPSDEHNGPTINLGGILDYGIPLGNQYRLSLENINKHALVVGVTGSGKTNTCFYLLKNLYKQGVPFLVIEPAKTEYRTLVYDPEMNNVINVFTLGNEQDSPFRINPFEFEENGSLSTHIDLLKSVFNAAFSMWTVLPQVLEQSLYQMYREWGWDIVRNENRRLTKDSPYQRQAFPTLTDLQHTIVKVVDRLGYEPKTTSEIKAALITRIQSLRIGGKGKMLDTRESFSMEKLLEKPVVFELEEIGDDDEKAFVIGLIFVRLYEHLRNRKQNRQNKLRHVVVVEEAHRLLTNVPTEVSSEVANTRGKAVETFVNMLSEIRAYGEGFIVAEQIPSKLSPDIIKNTNIKIIHRMVAGDDRSALGQTMNMKERQNPYLATLLTGQAAVFSEGDDAPLIVKVPEHNQEKAVPLPADMESTAQQIFDITCDCSAGCKSYTGRISAYCDLAQDIAERQDMQDVMAKYIISITDTSRSVDEMLPVIIQRIQQYHPGVTDSVEFIQSVLIHSCTFYFNRMGSLYQWKFDDYIPLQGILVKVLLQLINDRNYSQASYQETLAQFVENYTKLCRRNFDPFTFCSQICKEPFCLYRYHTARFLTHKKMHNDFMAAVGNAKNPEELQHNLEITSSKVTFRCLAQTTSKSIQAKVALCYIMQKAEATGEIPAALQGKLIRQLIKTMQDNPESNHGTK